MVPVGITQMACVEDPRETRARQVRLIERAAELATPGSGTRASRRMPLLGMEYLARRLDDRARASSTA